MEPEETYIPSRDVDHDVDTDVTFPASSDGTVSSQDLTK